MLERMETMFDGMSDMMKRLKKASYEKNMRSFRAQNEHYFLEMTDLVRDAADAEKEQAAAQAAEVFASKVEAAFGMNGRIRSRTQADLNFFMIFYVFPAILLTDRPEAKMVADAVRDEWRARFQDSAGLDYRDYDTLYNSFHEKIFGIF